MKASVHIGPNYNEKLEVYRNTNFEELKNLWVITQRLIEEQLFRSCCSYWRKEVEWYSCFWSGRLKIGHAIGTSLWSTRKGHRRRCSLEINGYRTAKRVSEGWEGTNSRALVGFNVFTREATNLGCSVARIPETSFLYIRAAQGHTGGNVTAPELMGHVAAPFKWKEFLFHRVMLWWCPFDPQDRTHRWRTRKERRNTDHLLHTSQSIREQSRRWRILWWPLEAEKSTLPQQVEISSGRRLLDQCSPSTRQRTTVLANQIPCHDCMRLCAGRLRLQSDFSKRGKNLKWKTLDGSAWPEDGTREGWQAQQQQDTSESSASGSTRNLVRKEDQGIPTDNPEPPSIWKQMRSTVSHVEKRRAWI